MRLCVRMCSSLFRLFSSPFFFWYSTEEVPIRRHWVLNSGAALATLISRADAKPSGRCERACLLYKKNKLPPCACGSLLYFAVYIHSCCECVRVLCTLSILNIYTCNISYKIHHNYINVSTPPAIAHVCCVLCWVCFTSVWHVRICHLWGAANECFWVCAIRQSPHTNTACCACMYEICVFIYSSLFPSSPPTQTHTINSKVCETKIFTHWVVDTRKPSIIIVAAVSWLPITHTQTYTPNLGRTGTFLWCLHHIILDYYLQPNGGYCCPSIPEENRPGHNDQQHKEYNAFNKQNDVEITTTTTSHPNPFPPPPLHNRNENIKTKKKRWVCVQCLVYSWYEIQT